MLHRDVILVPSETRALHRTPRRKKKTMITIHLRYQIDAAAIDAFIEYAERWMEIVPRFGGVHHGYFLPAEGDSDEAFALFSFPSLAEYERYREASLVDPDSVAAYDLAQRTRCIVRYERRIQRPLLPRT
ncbi:hypothetical protein QE418_000392 [Microbacterium testaceum]|nr:hypothetical protein [Microbacterium testaceum]MDQ1178439.1 hypothetical protein [Microbacterium sp. SORGH_AS_0421]MDR6098515.1 hypothetical protein [Microbacterium sp. SORGH_AS_0454]